MRRSKRRVGCMCRVCRPERSTWHFQKCTQRNEVPLSRATQLARKIHVPNIIKLTNFLHHQRRFPTDNSRLPLQRNHRVDAFAKQSLESVPPSGRVSPPVLFKKKKKVCHQAAQTDAHARSATRGNEAAVGYIQHSDLRPILLQAQSRRVGGCGGCLNEVAPVCAEMQSKII